MFLDTANIEEIKSCLKSGIFKGVTTNPTILSKEKKSRDSQIEELLKLELPIIFVQMLGETAEEMKDDFEKLQSRWKDEPTIGIKVPLNKGGLEFIRYLKQEHPERKVLGTAIYSTDQALLGTMAGCDYLAVYVNRMENNNLDPFEAITQTRVFIDSRKSHTQIMAASFKNTNQIVRALSSGAHTVTVPPSLFEQMISKELAVTAVQRFNEDGAVY